MPRDDDVTVYFVVVVIFGRRDLYLNRVLFVYCCRRKIDICRGCCRTVRIRYVKFAYQFLYILIFGIVGYQLLCITVSSD